jgi:hypothetical protein
MKISLHFEAIPLHFTPLAKVFDSRAKQGIQLRRIASL